MDARLDSLRHHDEDPPTNEESLRRFRDERAPTRHDDDEDGLPELTREAAPASIVEWRQATVAEFRDDEQEQKP